MLTLLPGSWPARSPRCGENSAVLLLFVDQETTSKATSRPQIALNRVTLRMVPDESDDGAPWLVDDVTSDADEPAADPDSDRMAAMAAARDFTEAWNSFDPDTADEYVTQVTPLLSSKFASEFQGAADDVIEGIREQRLSSTVDVLQVGVASADDWGAEVLVSATAHRTAAGQKVDRYWRWQVSLVLVDGGWLVDSFKEI